MKVNKEKGLFGFTDNEGNLERRNTKVKSVQGFSIPMVDAKFLL